MYILSVLMYVEEFLFFVTFSTHMGNSLLASIHSDSNVHILESNFSKFLNEHANVPAAIRGEGSSITAKIAFIEKFT